MLLLSGPGQLELRSSHALYMAVASDEPRACSSRLLVAAHCCQHHRMLSAATVTSRSFFPAGPISLARALSCHVDLLSPITRTGLQAFAAYTQV